MFEIYFFENNIFMNQFSPRNNPSIVLTDSEKNHDDFKKKHEKLLSLCDIEEIEEYYEKPIKDKKKVSMGSKEMELFNVNIDESIAKEIEIKDKKNR